MLTLRKAQERGHTDLGWLDSHHSFSFGSYFDMAQMGFGPLRVINDDRVNGGGGFATHSHSDMEIITYVLSGALEHKDSLGNGSVIRRGDVQRMSAGTGIRHSEFNASKTEQVHFLQIWIIPEHLGLTPSYEQKTLPEDGMRGKLRLIASRDGRNDSVTVHRDTDVYAALLTVGETVTHTMKEGRSGWVQVALGAVKVNGEVLREGDGAALTEPGIEMTGIATETELLLFDMAD